MQVLDEVPMIWGSCYMVYTMHMVGIMCDDLIQYHGNYIMLCDLDCICIIYSPLLLSNENRWDFGVQGHAHRIISFGIMCHKAFD